MLCPVADTHALHYFLHLALPLSLSHVQICQRKPDVLFHIKLVYEVKSLEYETYLSFAYARAVFLFELCHLLAVRQILARSGIVKQSEDIKESRLTASRRISRAVFGADFLSRARVYIVRGRSIYCLQTVYISGGWCGKLEHQLPQAVNQLFIFSIQYFTLSDTSLASVEGTVSKIT